MRKIQTPQEIDMTLKTENETGKINFKLKLQLDSQPTIYYINVF